MLLLTPRLQAQTELAEEPVRFEYHAPDACPDEAGFVTRVRERTARGRWAEPHELARTFRITIGTAAQGWLGRVELLDDGGATVSRSVAGERCDEVASSLALITALALDSARRDTPAESGHAPPATPPPPAPSFRSPPAARAAGPLVAPASSRAVTGIRWGIAAGYAGAEHAFGGGLLGQVDFRGGWSLRLVAHYAADEFVADPQGRRAKLRTQGVETSVCAPPYRASVLSLSPCALFDAGYLHVAGIKDSRLTSARSDGIPWASLGTELRLAWEPAAPFWVEARVAGAFPLRKGYRFTFENPAADAYSVPFFAISTGLVGGVRFW